MLQNLHYVLTFGCIHLQIYYSIAIGIIYFFSFTAVTWTTLFHVTPSNWAAHIHQAAHIHLAGYSLYT